MLFLHLLPSALFTNLLAFFVGGLETKYWETVSFVEKNGSSFFSGDSFQCSPPSFPPPPHLLTPSAILLSIVRIVKLPELDKEWLD